MSPAKKAVALTIAGSDPSGGAGIQADLKTFHQFGVYGEAVITLVTVQNTCGVQRVECLAPDLVYDQIRALLGDIPPDAAKTGALGNPAIIEAIGALAKDFLFPLVVDPVLTAKDGVALLAATGIEALKTFLLPYVFLLTPNLEEAELFTGVEIRSPASVRRAAEKLASMGPQAVLLKGGHLEGDPVDVLFYQGQWTEFTCPRIVTRHTHGTGCTLSAAITASLASGYELTEAVGRAKHFVTEAIRNNPGLGAGSGPLDHYALF